MLQPCQSADSRTSTRLSYNKTTGLQRTAAEKVPMRTRQGNPVKLLGLTGRRERASDTAGLIGQLRSLASGLGKPA